MKSNVRFLDFFNKKIISLLFVVVALIPRGLGAQPFSSANSSFQQGVGLSAGESQTDVNQSSLAYTPFSPFSSSPAWPSQGNNPVLYGPGGDPIGGLPLENGSVVLLYLVIVYILLRLWHTRFSHKKVQVLHRNEFFSKRQQRDIIK